MKAIRIVRWVLLAIVAVSIAGLVYISNNREPEPCTSTLSPYANCVHYRYSEWQMLLMGLAVVAGIGFVGSFLIEVGNESISASD